MPNPGVGEMRVEEGCGARDSVVRTVMMALLIWGAGAAPASSQILNTLRGFESKEGLSGGVGTFFSATGGNTENLTVTGSARGQWQGTTQRWRFLVDGTRSRAAGSTTEESSVTHLRHNARLNDRWATIAFAQHQHDRFQRLTARYLFGVGARWDWIRRERLEGSWGLTPMLEAEKIQEESTEVSARFSTFVSLLGRVNDRTTVDLTAFVQPKADPLDDLRAVASASLKTAVSGKVSLHVQGSVGYDSDPADRVEKTDWKTRTGLSVDF